MKKIYTFIMSFMALSAIAQPTYNLNFWTVGSNVYVYGNPITDAVNPETPGANKTWNFSNISTTKFADASFVAPSATPYASSFPTANLATVLSINFLGVTFEVTQFYDKTSTQILDLGQRSSDGSDDLDMSLPKLVLPILTFNGTTTHTYQEVGMPSYSQEFKYDAYGTLTLPNGTFNNVIRIMEIDSDGPDTSFVFINSTNGAILVECNGDGSEAAFYSTTLVGENENTKTANMLKVYPNPVVNQAWIEFQTSTTEKATIKLYDITGKEVIQLADGNYPAGIHRISFRNQNLPKGVYFVSVLKGNESYTQKVILQ
jgi:hypothetical protein